MGKDVFNLAALHTRSLEYKRQHLWIISLGGDLDGWTAHSAARPTESLGDIVKVPYLTTYSKYQAAKGDWSPIDVVLNDPIEPSASKKIYDLATQQWNWETGRVTSKSQYARDIDLKLLSPDFEVADESQPAQPNSGIIEIWTLKNAFFTNVNWNQQPLTYDGNDRLQIGFTINYDAAILTSFK